MARKKLKIVPDQYDKYTEACPKMTRRWRRDVVPEIAAWLLVLRGRLDRSFTAAEQAAKQYQTDEMSGACARIYARIKMIDEFISQLYDKWSDFAWWDAVKLVEVTLDLAAEKPQHQPRIPGMIDGAKPEANT